MTDADVIVIGAGPAGLAAASRAAESGCSVLLLDEQVAPGGQIYRAVDACPPVVRDLLGDDYTEGRQLTERLRASGCHYVAGATVWKVDADGQVVYSVNHQAKSVGGRFVIVATGAIERPVPIPGWTLPGVMGVGAAQILLKTAALAVENAVLVGSGPLLYLLAVQLLRAGCPPQALVETQASAQYWRALRHLPAAVRNFQTLLKGRQWLHELKKAGVTRYTGATRLRITGEDRAASIEFFCGGRSHSLATDTVLLHQGVVPNTQITRSMNLDHHWQEHQRCFIPTLDNRGATSAEAIRVAGDGAGIVGAVASRLLGERVALHCLIEMDLVAAHDGAEMQRTLQRQIDREQSIRAFLDVLYAPPAIDQQVTDDTIVCRCEEVRVSDIQRYVDAGCIGPNQTKAFGRCGMGPCQGRYCGLTVTELLAAMNDMTPDAVGSYRIRSPLKPVTLGELASLHDTP